MDNISYIISEAVADTDTNATDFDILLYNLEEEEDIVNYTDTVNYTDNLYTHNINYNELYTLYTTYSVRSLAQIMNYYKMNCSTNQKKRLLKEDMILLLITFELDFANKTVVLKRLRLWENIGELSQDSYFKSYITFTV